MASYFVSKDPKYSYNFNVLLDLLSKMDDEALKKRLKEIDWHVPQTSNFDKNGANVKYPLPLVIEYGDERLLNLLITKQMFTGEKSKRKNYPGGGLVNCLKTAIEKRDGETLKKLVSFTLNRSDFDPLALLRYDGGVWDTLAEKAEDEKFTETAFQIFKSLWSQVFMDDQKNRDNEPDFAAMLGAEAIDKGNAVALKVAISKGFVLEWEHLKDAASIFCPESFDLLTKLPAVGEMEKNDFGGNISAIFCDHLVKQIREIANGKKENSTVYLEKWKDSATDFAIVLCEYSAKISSRQVQERIEHLCSVANFLGGKWWKYVEKYEPTPREIAEAAFRCQKEWVSMRSQNLRMDEKLRKTFKNEMESLPMMSFDYCVKVIETVMATKPWGADPLTFVPKGVDAQQWSEYVANAQQNILASDSDANAQQRLKRRI